MCVYHVELLCAVRIGLGWAHDVFSFAYHMLMHLSCIRTLISLYSYIDLCWYFFVCLSLSLSLSPYTLVCFMAPKCKSAPSQNPLHFGAFAKSFYWVFFDTNLPTIIYSRGWESLCGPLVTCHSMIIHEFYFNMHGFDYSVPHFITRIRDTHMVVTPDLISKVLHVLRVEFAKYPSCERLRICVQRRTLISLLWDTFFLGWPSKHPLLGLYQRSEIP